jgi:hypothetical protein
VLVFGLLVWELIELIPLGVEACVTFVPAILSGHSGPAGGVPY